MRRPTPYLVRVRRAENFHARQLRKAGAQVGELIKAWAQSHGVEVLDPANLPELQLSMEAYQRAITPWARAQAERMAEEVARRERHGFKQQSGQMSEALKRQLADASVGPSLTALVREQAADISSIPQEAAQRIFGIVGNALADPERSSAYIEEIMRSGEVTKSRATMLARTMVSAVSSDLVETRARNAGSEAYVWETMMDSAVRRSHRRMQGQIVRWDSPPTIDGYTAHAGRYANCRCYPRPIWPDFD